MTEVAQRKKTGVRRNNSPIVCYAMGDCCITMEEICAML